MIEQTEALVAGGAFAHAVKFGAANPFHWSWFGFDYTPAGFATTALVVVFFYWGWDVTANLGEETRNGEDNAGTGGLVSIFVTILYYIAFVFAALFLFSIKDAQGFNANIIYNIAVTAGFGRVGGLLASCAVILSSIATLETTMLQFSRTLFAMGRDGAMSKRFGIVDARTRTPVRAMLVLVAVGIALLWASCLMPTVSLIIADSRAVGAGRLLLRVGVWLRRTRFAGNAAALALALCLPAKGGILLIALGLYDYDVRSRHQRWELRLWRRPVRRRAAIIWHDFERRQADRRRSN